MPLFTYLSPQVCGIKINVNDFSNYSSPKLPLLESTILASTWFYNAQAVREDDTKPAHISIKTINTLKSKLSDARPQKVFLSFSCCSYNSNLD